MQNAENKSNKYVVLATYAVAVLCLIMGLVLPLFNGKEMLVSKLGDVFKSLLNKENNFGLAYPVTLFGIGSKSFDFAALVVVLYTVITALSVLAFIPVVLSIRKEGKLAVKFYYGIEIAAIIVISLFFVVELFPEHINYNMVIAGCGTTVALLALCGLDKGKVATIKIVLFLLSVIGFLALFDFVMLLSKEDAFAKLTNKISSGMVGEKIEMEEIEITASLSGVYYLTALFADKLSAVLGVLPNAKEKALLVLAAIAATVVLINFFIDAVKLSTNKEKKGVLIFDIARYGVAFAAVIDVLVAALICSKLVGLMLIFMLIVTAIQLVIVLVKFILGVRKKARDTQDADSENVGVADIDDSQRVNQPLLLESGNDNNIEDNTQDSLEEENTDEEPNTEEQLSYDSILLDDMDEEFVPPAPDDDGYIDPALDEQQQLAAQQEASSEEPQYSELDYENLEDTEIYEPEDGTTYLVPVENSEDKQSEEAEAADGEVAEDSAEESLEEPETSTSETEEPIENLEQEAERAIEESVEEPVVAEETEESLVEAEEVAEPIVEEEIEESVENAQNEPEAVEESVEEPVVAEETDDGLEESANPFREEIKPYNPYERHNNPFKAFEEPPQPYNPYRQQEPTQSAYDKPVQSTTRFAYDKPVQSYKSYEQPAQPVERPRTVKPLQPRPIIQEFKPVPPISEQPPQRQVYTIDTLYAGPIDEFIRKLSNDERIEFAKTFLEKNRGNLGSIPDYVVGGDNKKFFSSAFIYLGRIRGMVSDGLLNKMYKELNLL